MLGSVVVYLSLKRLHRRDVRLIPIIVNHMACAIDVYGLALAPKSSRCFLEGYIGRFHDQCIFTSPYILGKTTPTTRGYIGYLPVLRVNVR